jgi:RNA polymerase sigma-70 factor (ECF subfamily)
MWAERDKMDHPLITFPRARTLDPRMPEATLKNPMPEQPSEAMALAKLAARGDKDATSKLLRLLAPRLSRVVRAVLGAQHPDVDDAFQLSLIGFVQALPAFRGECDPAGYATTITVRTALATRRRARTLATRQENAEVSLPPHAGPSPRDEAESTRRKDMLRELLGQLAPEQGETLAMRVVLGWSLGEIAEQTGAPLNTVRSRLRLAKEALKKRIESDKAMMEMLEVSA